jgi:hypothetical protein
MIACLNPDCTDDDGHRPAARLDWDARGQAKVCWNDGRVTGVVAGAA